MCDIMVAKYYHFFEPTFRPEWAQKKPMVVVMTASIMFLFGLIFCFNGGVYMFRFIILHLFIIELWLDDHSSSIESRICQSEMVFIFRLFDSSVPSWNQLLLGLLEVSIHIITRTSWDSGTLRHVP